MMTENFIKFTSDTKPNIQKSQRATSKINAKKVQLGILHSNYRKSKIGKKFLKEARGKKRALPIKGKG